MKLQNELKKRREDFDISITSLKLQTGLSKKVILDSEDSNIESDLSVYLVLRDFYARLTSSETTEILPLYHSWLASLEQGDDVILKESIIGSTDSFLYSSESIEQICSKKILLSNKMYFNKHLGTYSYVAPNGVEFFYKIYPKTDQIETSSKKNFIQKAIGIFTTDGLL